MLGVPCLSYHRRGYHIPLAKHTCKPACLIVYNEYATKVIELFSTLPYGTALVYYNYYS